MPVRTVIYIDDDPLEHTIAARTSSRLDCEFLFFERASDVFSSIGFIEPRLMIIDLMMTNLDGEYGDRAGIEVTRDIRNCYGDRFPILILTGTEDARIISQCLRNGADDYHVKDHDITGLVKRVAAWLVYDYPNTDARRERAIAADVLDRIVANQSPLTTREWRRNTLHEICRNEEAGETENRYSGASDLIAWRPSLSLN